MFSRYVILRGLRYFYKSMKPIIKEALSARHSIRILDPGIENKKTQLQNYELKK